MYLVLFVSLKIGDLTYSGFLKIIRYIVTDFPYSNLGRELCLSKGEGMQLLDQAIMELLMQKKIAPEEAYLKANDKNAFERFLKKG